MENLIQFIFKADNKSTIRALKGIADESTNTTRTVKKNAEETATVYERVGKSTIALRERVNGLAGMVGLGGLAFGLKDAVQGGMQLGASQAQLQQALRATGQATGDTYARMKDFAEGLSTKGGFATDENLQALTAFTRETHNAGQAQSMLGLATDIARGRSMDLASAQSVVARAYTGQVGRLQQLLGPMVASKDAAYGLSQAHREEIANLELESQAMGRSGAAWLRQQEILRGITPKMQDLALLQDKSATAQQVMAAASRVFGGATGAYAGTTQGKISDLQNSLKNLTDTTGQKLLPAVNLLAKDLTYVIGAFGALPAPVQAAALGLTAAGLLAGPLSHVKDAAMGAGRMLGILQTNAGDAAVAEARVAGASGLAAGGEAAAGAGGAAALGGEAAAGGPAGMAGKLLGGGKSLLRGGLLALGGAIAADTLRNATGIGNHHGKHSGIGGLAGTIIGGGAGSLLGPWGTVAGAGLGNLAGGFIGSLFHSGGVVRPRYLAMGGPMGSDVVPAWLTPGEGVLSTRGMAMLGMLNSGSLAGGTIVVQPGVTIVKIDSREVAEAVTRYTANRAARGPGTFTGGSLVMGAPGLH